MRVVKGTHRKEKDRAGENEVFPLLRRWKTEFFPLHLGKLSKFHHILGCFWMSKTSAAPLTLLEANLAGGSWNNGMEPPCLSLSNMKQKFIVKHRVTIFRGQGPNIHSGSSESCQKCGLLSPQMPAMGLTAGRKRVAATMLMAVIIRINCNLSAKLFPGSCKCSNKLQCYEMQQSL